MSSSQTSIGPDTAPVAEPGVQEHGSRLFAITLIAAAVVGSTMQTLILPVLPAIASETGATTADTGWLVTITMLAGTVASPLFGRLGDLFGPRPVLLLAMTLTIIGSLSSAAGPDLLWILIGRGLQGAALGVVPLGISLIYAAFEQSRARRMVGWLSSSLGIGGVIGVPLAAVLAQLAGWRSIFISAAVLMALLLLVLLRTAPRTRGDKSGRFDGVGAAGLTAALVLFLVPLSNPSGASEDPAIWYSSLGAGVVMITGWVLWERRAKSPFVNLNLIRSRPMALAIIFSVLIGLAFFANTMPTSLMVQAPEGTGYGQGASVFIGGLALLPTGIALIVFSPVSTWLSSRTSPKVVLLIGSLVLAAGYITRVLLHDSLSDILLGTGIVGIGIALTFVCLPLYAMGVAKPGERSTTNGLLTLSRLLGTTISSAAITAALGSMTIQLEGTEHPSLLAYQVVFAVAAALSVIALVIAPTLPRQSRPST